MATTTPVTAADLPGISQNLSLQGKRCELVAGELRIMSPGGWKHGMIGGWLSGRLASHIQQNDLGLALMAETGFWTARDPDTVRAPDFAFIAKASLPERMPEEESYWPGTPDLAVEVVSKNDRAVEVEEKAVYWLEAGVKQVWVVDPKTETITVFRSPDDRRPLARGDMLEGDPELLPGFVCGVAEVFGG